jgi:MinD-like ATPase involved in chromosome partitioning or flagellar assembly
MADFDLDLREAEAQLDDMPSDEVVLGVLNGETEDTEWVQSITQGNVLVLSVDGDLNELAAGFAREIKDMGGELMHFRDFLIITPPETAINTDRL